jgi:DNA-binding transcriptional regulator/RsmH inhibitor MraZ
MMGEVTVLGNLNFLEVWNHKRFIERLSAQSFTQEDKLTLSQLGI